LREKKLFGRDSGWSRVEEEIEDDGFTFENIFAFYF
jgi:hypothetical protein